MNAHVRLPNIRKQFIPDPGYAIVDMDLSGADAQVVAWEADDEPMKQAFRDGIKIHVFNARTMFEEWADKTTAEIKKSPVYGHAKILCHATNYVGSAPTIATNVGWPISLVEDFQERWFIKHPGILEWHRRTERHLDGSECWRCYARPDPGTFCTRCNAPLGGHVKNAFGYRIRFFDRVERLLPEAVAWVPQSTVAIVTQRALLILAREFPTVEVLLQVHDSLVFQILLKEIELLDKIKERLDRIEIPYPDPLFIPWGVAVSEANWGECG